MRVRVLLLAALATVTLSGALIGKTHAQERVLHVVSPWEITDLEPAETGYVFRRLGVAETLVEVEPDGQLVGGVAESWSNDSDRLTWRFKIRPGMRFHDGMPVTAAAVVNSLHKVREAGESLQALPIASMTAEGDHVILRTTRPFAPLPAYLTDYAGIILSPNAYGRDGKVKAMIATGYYRVTRIDGQKQAELEAFPDYWGRKPLIAKARYSAASLGETRAALAESGNADVTFTLLPQAAQRIDRSGVARIMTLTIPRTRVLNFDCASPFFADLRVRQAISLAIDRPGIAASLLRHPASAATQLLPPTLTGWHQPDLSPMRQDIQASKALLAEAGWQAGPGGILEKQGVAFKVVMQVPSNRPEFPVIASALQAQLKAVGIAVELKIGASSEIPQMIRDGTLQIGFLSRTYVNVPDPIATLIPDFTQDKSVWGSVNWRNDRVRQLARAYTESFEPSAQTAIQRDLMTILHHEMPVIPVAWTEHTVAVSTAVTGLVIDPYELRYFLNRVGWIK